MTQTTKTIVLIHGLWMTPRSWDPFRRFFEEHGYRVLTPPWPHLNGEVEDIRCDSSAMNGLGVKEIADHYERFIRKLDEPPIIMGHSYGGLIVQILLDRGLGAVGVAIDSAPPKGILRLPLATLRSVNPVLSNPRNYNRTVALTFEQFRYAFANNMSEKDARVAYNLLAVPGPGRVLFQTAFANLNPKSETKVNYENNTRVPLLMIGGGDDHTFPPELSRRNFKKYAKSKAITEYKEFPNRSHLIVSQKGWQEVAEYALSWAQTH